MLETKSPEYLEHLGQIKPNRFTLGTRTRSCGDSKKDKDVMKRRKALSALTNTFSS